MKALNQLRSIFLDSARMYFSPLVCAIRAIHAGYRLIQRESEIIRHRRKR